jgi:hypothetical protein
MTAAEKAATIEPLFQKQQYHAIAKLIGYKNMYSVMDEKDYRIIEAFAEMFEEDNPTAFDKVRFTDAVYEAHGKKNCISNGG